MSYPIKRGVKGKASEGEREEKRLEKLEKGALKGITAM